MHERHPAHGRRAPHRRAKHVRLSTESDAPQCHDQECRCVCEAERPAEIALVSRDLKSLVKALETAHEMLATHTDHANAAQVSSLKARYLLLIGRLDQAEQFLAGFDPAALPPASRAGLEFVVAGIAMRRLRITAARHWRLSQPPGQT